MESTLSCNVHDLPATERQSLEEILGQPLGPEQRVFIMAYTPNVVPDKSVREAARMGLQRTFDKIDEHAAMHGVAPEEADTAVEEAMGHVRPRQP